MTTDQIVMPHGWKRVQMPDRIAERPRDRKGFPIPYVAEWNSGQKDRLTEVGQLIRMDCKCTIGVGEPQLGNQCPTRQRECMSQHVCQVCSYKIEESEPFHFLGSLEGNVFWEPPVHQECAAYSLQVCPGITRRPGVGVQICREFELGDKLDLNPGDPEATKFVATGTLPPLLAMGLAKAGFAFHVGIPINPIKVPAAEFLERVGG